MNLKVNSVQGRTLHYACKWSLEVHKLALQGRDICYTAFLICKLTSVVHKPAFQSKNKHYTAFYTSK